MITIVSGKKVFAGIAIGIAIFGLFGFSTGQTFFGVITPKSVEAADFTCDITTDATQVFAGDSVTLTWSSSGYATVRINGESKTLSGSERIDNIQINTTYTLVASSADGTVNCQSSVTVFCLPVPPPTCTLTPTTEIVPAGGAVTLTWTSTNSATVSLTDFSTVPPTGTRNTGPLTSSKTYTLTVVGNNGTNATCTAVITVTPVDPNPLPQCTGFTATPASIAAGGSATLAWTTQNANRVTINNGIGEVQLSGTAVVTPLTTLEYTLTAFDAANNQATCRTTVTVGAATPLPQCVSFTATPATLPVGGGSALLSWNTTNANGVTISPQVGASSADGDMTVAVATTTTFTLTALGANNQTASCTTAVTVAAPVTPSALTCQNNVTFSSNTASIERGNSATLTWSTTGVTGVSFNQGITATGLSGSTTVSPTATTQYLLTASTATSTVSCPVTVTVTEPSSNGGGGGGGGGGSSAPRCELTVSKSKISSGEMITLRWDSTRASDIKITDGTKTIVTTKGLLSEQKKDLYDGSKKLTPTKDTKYTLTVERGSRDTVCTATVDVNDDVAFTELRDQQPLIAGIALADVPYTGFEAGPVMTLAFYTLLAAWAVFIAYFLVIRRDSLAGYRFARREAHIVAENPTPEQIRPDVFVTSVTAPVIPPSAAAPVNLPIATRSNTAVVGYESLVTNDQKVAVPTISSNTHQADDEAVTTLENMAHDKKALLSSDAIRHFIATTTTPAEREKALLEVITLARGKYPSEDGWVVINEKRMQELCTTCQVNAAAEVVKADPYVPTVIPEGSGSLAEAIVTGNVVAAYEMIGHRPMFALADAAADLDSIYRARKGAKIGVISEMLTTEAAKLSDDQIMAMIQALTGALDGVYTDEASAVKMAIMKAVKVAA